MTTPKLSEFMDALNMENINNHVDETIKLVGLEVSRKGSGRNGTDLGRFSCVTRSSIVRLLTTTSLKSVPFGSGRVLQQNH